MQGTRTVRVGQRIQEALMDVLLRGSVKDPRVAQNGLLTITRVEVTGDLRHARVFFVLHGGDEAAAELGLAAARGFLRREVGRALALKVTPELEFTLDRGLEQSEKVQRLLAEVAAEGKPSDD